MKKLITTSLLLLSSFGFLKAQENTDSLLLDLDFIETSVDDFLKSKSFYNESLSYDYTKNLKRLGVDILHSCDEICESYLVEKTTREKMWLPSNYDAGILGFNFSPSGNFLMVYSSYDGPDYDNYYEYRAEIFIFSVGKEKGLKAIKLYGSYYTKDWSITDIVWGNNNTIALKVYEGERRGDGIEGDYKYLKAVIE